MKKIKLLLVFAVISLIAVSCKETKKEDIDDDTETIEVIEESTATTIDNSASDNENATSDDVEKPAEAREKKLEESVAGATHDVEKLDVDGGGVMVETMADTPVIYPGCEGGTHEEIRACSLKMLKKYLRGNIDPNLASDLNLDPGSHMIRSLVKINKEGVVSVIKIDAEKKAIEKEIVKLVSSLPKMTPATKNGAPVSVSFIVPIDYKVSD